MGYSLGDDRESFDVFDKTIEIHKKICDELIKNNWKFDNKKYTFSKNSRDLRLEVSEDHVDSLYVYSDTIDWERFANRYGEFDCVHGDNHKIEGVETYVCDKTDAKKIVNKLEYAPLLEKDLELES